VCFEQETIKNLESLFKIEVYGNILHYLLSNLLYLLSFNMNTICLYLSQKYVSVYVSANKNRKAKITYHRK